MTGPRASRAPTIAVVGSCNVDLVAYVARAPEAGETVLGERFVTGFGGKGANQAVMAARLGATVSMIGALGDDLYADTTLANFDEQGVDRSRIARVAGSSGVAPIWVEADGTNRIIVVPGANGLVEPEAAARAIAELETIGVVIGQLEIPQEATAAAFATARARGATTVLNPAPAAPLESRLMEATDWLVPNEGEVAALAGVSATSGSAAWNEAMVELGNRLKARLVVTLGAGGAALVVDGTVATIPAPRVEAIDTTGAGDAFVGAFAVGLGLGLDPATAVRLGIACASDSVTRPGTQASYPDRRRAEDLRAWSWPAAGEGRLSAG